MADGNHLTPAPSGRPPSAPDETWARVREDYLAGASAPDCCRIHGVGLTALRDRAAREGWRRIDQPFSPPVHRLDPWDEGVALDDRVGGDLDKVELRELAYVALRRMMRAVLRGDAAEALRWRRVKLAMEDEAAEMERFIAREHALQVHRDDEEDHHAEHPGTGRLSVRFPSPLEGEGAPEGRMRGEPDAHPAPADLASTTPSSDALRAPPSPSRGEGTDAFPDGPDGPDGVFLPPPDLERKGLAFPHDLLRLRPLGSRLPDRPGREQRPRLVHGPSRRL